MNTLTFRVLMMPRLEGFTVNTLQGWLCVVEDMMHKSLKDVLRASRLDLKKHLSKREKWVRDWPGQVRSRKQSRDSPINTHLHVLHVLYGVRVGITFLSSLYALS